MAQFLTTGLNLAVSIKLDGLLLIAGIHYETRSNFVSVPTERQFDKTAFFQAILKKKEGKQPLGSLVTKIGLFLFDG